MCFAFRLTCAEGSEFQHLDSIGKRMRFFAYETMSVLLFAVVRASRMRFANTTMNVLLFAVVRASRMRFANETMNALLFCRCSFLEDAF